MATPNDAPSVVSNPFAGGHASFKKRMGTKSKLIQQMLEEGPPTAPTAPPRVTSTTSANGGKLIDHLKQAGFKGEELRKAWAVAMRESGGRADAYNGNERTGDKSYGLFQINMLGKMGAARQKQFGLSSYNDLLDPVVNAKAAYQMSRGGWSAWDIDESGYNYNNNRASWQKHYNAYQKYYSQYPGETNKVAVRSAAAARLKK